VSETQLPTLQPGKDWIVVNSRKIPINSGEPSRLQSEDDSFEASPQYRVVDRRHFTDAATETPATGYVEEKPRYPTYVEELLAKVADTERRFKEKVAQIDQETARTRVRLEAEYERKLVLDKLNLMQPLLDVLDNLERALHTVSAGGNKADLLEGVKMTAALFQAKLKAQAIEPIEVINQPFDPNLSQAIGVVPVADQAKDGIVVEEVLRGYRMGETLLRPAQVRVGEFRPDR
jgi:molecular chaperone GrpE